MAAHAAHDMKKTIRTYYMVFGALMVFTIITVAVSYLDLPVAMAIFIALVVASIKGSLVALFFMHLIDERKLVYWVLSLTVVFFVFLMFVPLATNLNKIMGTIEGTLW
jgi:cytochrome c oxidase subunit 4